LLTLFSDLFPDPTASDLEHNLSMGHPTSPILERPLSLSHPRLVSLDTDGHVWKDSHPAFGTLDGLDLSLDGDFGGLELFGREADGGEEAETVGSKLKGCSLGRTAGGKL
jgi:hypothetical protein